MIKGIVKVKCVKNKKNIINLLQPFPQFSVLQFVIKSTISKFNHFKTADGHYKGNKDAIARYISGG